MQTKTLSIFPLTSPASVNKVLIEIALEVKPVVLKRYDFQWRNKSTLSSRFIFSEYQDSDKKKNRYFSIVVVRQRFRTAHWDFDGGITSIVTENSEFECWRMSITWLCFGIFPLSKQQNYNCFLSKPSTDEKLKIETFMEKEPTVIEKIDVGNLYIETCLNWQHFLQVLHYQDSHEKTEIENYAFDLLLSNREVAIGPLIQNVNLVISRKMSLDTEIGNYHYK